MEETKIIEEPGTSHTLSELKDLSEDALMVVEHRLRTHFKLKQSTAEKHLLNVLDELIPHLNNYNMALISCFDIAVTKLENDLNSGLVPFNIIQDANRDSAVISPDHLRWTLYFSDASTLYNPLKATPDVHHRFISNMLSTYSNVSHRRSEYTVVELLNNIFNIEGDVISLWASWDLHTVPNSKNKDLIPNYSYKEIHYTHLSQIPVEMTEELKVAIDNLAEHSQSYLDAVQQCEELEVKIENLPIQMRELQVQAATTRVTTNGGSQLLDALTQTAQSIIDGEDVTLTSFSQTNLLQVSDSTTESDSLTEGTPTEES